MSFKIPVEQRRRQGENLPFCRAQSSSVVSASPYLDIRPPAGIIYEVLYASVQLSAWASPPGGAWVELEIRAVVNGTDVMLFADRITQGDGQTFNQIHVEVGNAAGLGMFLSNNAFLRLRATHSGMAAGTAVADFFASVRVREE